MTRPQVIDTGRMVAHARTTATDVEFSAEDAARSDLAFLQRC